MNIFGTKNIEKIKRYKEKAGLQKAGLQLLIASLKKIHAVRIIYIYIYVKQENYLQID